MLDQIIKVKGFRLDAAKKDLQAARQVVAQREQELEQHLQQIEDFKVFIINEKTRLFKQIENEQVGLKSINSYKEKITMLKEQLVSMEQQVPEFENQLEEAEVEFEEVRERYTKCEADMRKYEEVQKEVLEAEAIEIVRKEEVELEDVASKSRLTQFQ